MWGTWVSSCMSILVKSILKCLAASLDWLWLEGWRCFRPKQGIGHTTWRSSMVLICVENSIYIIMHINKYLYRQYVSIHSSYKGLFLHDERCRIALIYEHSKLGTWTDAAYASGLGNVLEGSWSHFHEELAFFKPFPDSERFHPLSHPHKSQDIIEVPQSWDIMQHPNLTWACRLHFGRLEGDCQCDWYDKDDATHQGNGWWLGLDAMLWEEW